MTTVIVVGIVALACMNFAYRAAYRLGVPDLVCILIAVGVAAGIGGY